MRQELKAFIETQNSSSDTSSTSNKLQRSKATAAIQLKTLPVIDYSKTLGQGSFGTVYEGRYGNEVVAVKMISGVASLTPTQLAELTKEVTMHNKVCNLPGVVRLFGANLSKEPRCIVLELADGSLHDVLHKRSPLIDLSVPAKLAIALEVASTMEFISELGIIHRDIKSSNVLIFIQGAGRVGVKLSDFGLAKTNVENTYATGQTPKGTPPYMAPELFQGQYSTQSDVYAFAVMLNELLTEDIPFLNETMQQIIFKVGTLKARPALLTATRSDVVGSRLVKLITTCWHQDLSLRMDFAGMASKLGQLLTAAVEVAKHGQKSVKDSSAGQHTAEIVEAACLSLSDWLTKSCGLLPTDSTALAHTLVTTKCITSVQALADELQHSPDFMSGELKVQRSYVTQIKKALLELQDSKMIPLRDLSVEQVCSLLASCNMSGSVASIEEHEISGVMLATSFTTVEELKEIDIKPVAAKTLLKLIGDWNLVGVPLTSLSFESTTATKTSVVNKNRSVKSNPTPTIKKAPRKKQSTADEEMADTIYNHFRVAHSPNTTHFADQKSIAQLVQFSTNGNRLASALLAVLDVLLQKRFPSSRPAVERNESQQYAHISLAFLQDEEVSESDKYAQFCLGCFYLHGIVVPKNEVRALQFLRLSATAGVFDAKSVLVECCMEWSAGKTPDVAKDCEVEAYKLLLELVREAKPENSHLFLLAGCLAEGIGCSKDLSEAFTLYKQASELGHVISTRMAGTFCEKGLGVPLDRDEAIKYFKIAATSQDKESIASLAHIYLRDNIKLDLETCRLFMNLVTGVKHPEVCHLIGMHYKHETSAAYYHCCQYFTWGADGGYFPSMVELGRWYIFSSRENKQGTNGLNHTTLGLDWLVKASEAGSVEGVLLLVEVILEQPSIRHYIPQYTATLGPAVALRCCQKVSETSSDPLLLYYLGKLHADSEGKAANLTEAFKYYLQAATAKHPEACLEAGKCLIKGFGTQKYEKKGFNLLCEASTNMKSPAEAWYELGECYSSGTGVVKNEATASEKYQLAAEGGHPESQYKMAVLLYLDGIHAASTTSIKAVEYCKSAAKTGHLAASLWMAQYFDKRYQPNEAIPYYRHCSEKGVAEAHFRGAELMIASNIVNRGAFAREMMERAVKEDCKNPEAHYWLYKEETLRSYYANETKMYEHLRAAADLSNKPEYIREFANFCAKYPNYHFLAIPYYERTAETDVGIQYALVDHYLKGAFGNKPDPVKAAKYLTMAAQNGFGAAAWELSQHYRDGNPLLAFTKDLAKYVQFLTIAVEKSQPQAMAAMSSHCFAGDMVGITEDLQRGAELLVRAENRPNTASGMLELAHHFTHGQCGVQVNRIKAGNLLNALVARGDASAQYLVAIELLTSGTRVVKDVLQRLPPDSGVELLAAAAQSGHAGAQCELATITLKGLHSVKKSRTEAKRLYGLAAEQGNVEARDALAAMWL